MTEQQEKVREAIGAMRNLGVSLNDYDSDMLEILYQFAEDSLATNAAQAEQLAKLEDALRRLYCGYVNTVENGRSRIIYLGGDCDPVDVMEQSDPLLIEMRALLQSSTPTEPQAGVELTDEEILAVMEDCPVNTNDHGEHIAFARAIERALNQRQAVKAEPLSANGTPPEGYVLVPIEPTKQMRQAAINEQQEWLKLSLGLQGDEPASAIYRAMLATAPASQDGETDRG